MASHSSSEETTTSGVHELKLEHGKEIFDLCYQAVDRDTRYDWSKIAADRWTRWIYEIATSYPELYEKYPGEIIGAVTAKLYSCQPKQMTTKRSAKGS